MSLDDEFAPLGSGTPSQSHQSCARVPGLPNLRDVAISSADLRLRRLVLLRSACPSELEPEGVTALVERCRVRRVVDLRSRQEREAVPLLPLRGVPGVEIIECSLISQELEIGTDLPWEAVRRRRVEGGDMDGPYGQFVRDRPDSVVRALRAIASGEGATLVHCSAGKDRTGVVVAVCLRAVGVDVERVLADFVMSNDALTELLAQQQRTTFGARYRGRDPMTYRVQPESLLKLLSGLERDYGGVGGWLRDAGWVREDQERLERRLLEPAREDAR